MDPLQTVFVRLVAFWTRSTKLEMLQGSSREHPVKFSIFLPFWNYLRTSDIWLVSSNPWLSQTRDRVYSIWLLMQFLSNQKIQQIFSTQVTVVYNSHFDSHNSENETYYFLCSHKQTGRHFKSILIFFKKANGSNYNLWIWHEGRRILTVDVQSIVFGLEHASSYQYGQQQLWRRRWWWSRHWFNCNWKLF